MSAATAARPAAGASRTAPPGLTPRPADTRPSGYNIRMSTLLPLIIIVVAAFLAFVVGAVVAHRKGFKQDGEVAARCSQGHLFMTVWVDRWTWKRLDVGFLKIQRCPVGDHWSVVRPLEMSSLTADEKKLAKQTHDAVPARKRPTGP